MSQNSWNSDPLVAYPALCPYNFSASVTESVLVKTVCPSAQLYIDRKLNCLCLIETLSGTTRNYTQNDERGAYWGTYPWTGCQLIPNMDEVRLFQIQIHYEIRWYSKTEP